MKIKNKILIPLALFSMFSLNYQNVSAAIVEYVPNVDYTVHGNGFSNPANMFDGNMETSSTQTMLRLYNHKLISGNINNVKEIRLKTNGLFTRDTSKMKAFVYPYQSASATGMSVSFEGDDIVYYSQYSDVLPSLGEFWFSDFNTLTGFQVYEVQVNYDDNDGIPPAQISNLNYVFGDDNSVTYTYDLPSDPDFSHIEVYQDAQLIKDDYKGASLKITDLLPETNYNFHFYAVDKSGNKSIVKSSTIQMPAGPDLIAPQNITNVQKVVSDDTIQFSYLLPIDSDFSHLQVYRNNVLIAPNVQLASFVDEGLDYETSYTYSFKSVDTSGNISEGTTLTVQTMPYNDLTAPSAPTGLDVLSGNSSLALSWFPNPENDVQGYNIYVDGVKRNGAPVFGNSYSLTNLANANEYSIQLSAVDTNGNESVLTVEKIAIPDGSKIPFFKLDNDLTDVVESTENWFSEMWLIVAFSAGIPLAFVVGNRIKSLFFA